jgi:hypothetical protein
MIQEINAIFDGKSLPMESPLNLDVGTRVKIIVETILPQKHPPKTFLETAQSLELQGNPDWSEKIDQYLYGETVSTAFHPPHRNRVSWRNCR